MQRSSIPFALIIAFTCDLKAQDLHLTVDPPAGPPSTVFTITLANLDAKDFIYDDCCALPRIATLYGQDVFCPICPLKPCIPGSGVLPGGRFIQFEWEPWQYPCEGVDLRPGIYEVGWDGFPDSVASRLEILPETGLGLEVTAEPATVRFGEPVKIALKNSSSSVLTYNRCCYPPEVLDPWGIEALCVSCIECIEPVELAPSESLTFDWTPGESDCNAKEYPGRYRILWGGFFEGELGIGAEHIGAASVLVLPRENRRLDLELSSSLIHPGEVLKITATNPLEVSVWHYLMVGCNDLILLDPLGREAFCRTACPPYVAEDEAEEIQPGGQISRDIVIPDPGGCGLSYGRWSVIWGRYFGLTSEPGPGQQVFGYGEIEVEGRSFIRGDCDGLAPPLELTDVIFFLDYLFLGGGIPSCLDACDANDSGELDISDAVAAIFSIYLGGEKPPAPFPDPGPDPTADALGCAD